jgi:GNAT superfamily N-acetyltransferase
VVSVNSDGVVSGRRWSAERDDAQRAALRAGLPGMVDATHYHAIADRELVHAVADADGVFVGFLVSHRGGVQRLRHRCDFTMAIRRDHQHRGIGTLLLRSMQAWAGAGDPTDRIDRDGEQQGSHLALRAEWFHNRGAQTGAIVVHGKSINEIMMGTRVGAVQTS